MSTTWSSLTLKLIKQAREKETPLAGAFELTSRCNFKCRMCYVCQPSNNRETEARELTTSEWLRMAEEVRDEGALFITLTGGEIFLRKDIKDIYENMTKMGYRITLYTNASLIDADTAKWLGRIPPSIVSITIYGASDETYAKVCGVRDGFKKVIRSIDLLISEGIELELKTTMIKGNRHEFEQIADLANKRGVELGVIDYVSPRREGCFSDPVGERLSPSEMAILLKQVKEYKINRSGINYIANKNIRIDNEAAKDILWRDSDGAFRCSVCKWGYWISWDGRLIPCGLLSDPGTYPLQEGFHSAWNELKKLCKNVPVATMCKECENLEHCDICPARLKAETGFFDKKAPYLCEFTKQKLLVGSK